jgi:triosephosphate isomerase (TIM)
MRTPLVAGNWKMNGTQASVRALVAAITAGAGDSAGVQVLLCPSYVFLPIVQEVIASSSIELGAQDVFTEAGGAFTGEISGPMLADAGCSFVLVGHSERRTLLGESDELVASKFAAAQKAGLTPVLCVGETLAERQSNSTLSVISRQLNAVIDAVGIDAFAQAVVAYEPVWAIGTGETASPEQAQEVHAAIRGIAAERSAKIAAGLRLLYGGSVKAANAPQLFSMPDIDGGLIGGASLDAGEFLGICAAAAS